jgi:hypothetical protein
MATKTITVTKIDQIAESPKVIEKKAEPLPKPPVKKGGKTMKTFPKGILKTAKHSKIKPVSDPAKPPPLKKSMKKHTIRLLTDKGVRRHRKTIKRKIAGMSDEKVKNLVTKHGLLKNSNTPVPIMREMLEGGAISGFISLS